MLSIATAISDVGDLTTLLALILSKARDLTCSDAGSVYLIEPGRRSQLNPGQEHPALRFHIFQNSSLPDEVVNRFTEESRLQEQNQGKHIAITHQRLTGWTALTGDVLNIRDVRAIPAESPYQFDDSIDCLLGYRTVSMLVVPLRTMAGRIIGVMQLINRKHEASAIITSETAATLVRPYDRSEQLVIEALANLAAVCVQRTLLLESQQRQIDSMISMLAGAIDARSPHTGGHCERVPELAMLLAKAAEETQEGPLAEFRFQDQQEWREFRTAAWLHDCGKITTPDCVVEKATKLDAWVNRISEIRTRFEVLLRDARIEMLEAKLAGGDPDRLEGAYQARARQLSDDFAFIAGCNIGSERMDPSDEERLKHLASQPWQRHFDDRLGLGWEERARFPEQSASLPATETLLADKPWHHIPRPEKDIPDPAWGFRMDVPRDLYNRGELYNLSVSKGTLTTEERYLVKEHMIYTNIMLESIDFPADMARIPEYAGSHHETLTGNGYPRGLSAAQLSIPARILAIADIFEALTASDRPYKKSNTVSEALRILEDFRARGNIDGDLLDVFIRSGVWHSYAKRFLKPEQLDIAPFGISPGQEGRQS